MPIEIRELVVRARIEPGADSPAGSGTGQRTDGAGRDAEPRESEQEMVRACVREALRAMEDRRER